MFETENSLVKLLNDTTLAINLQGGIATGFWVGQGLVITCAHVVEEAYKSNANVTVTWKGTAIAARVVDFLNDIDLALLEVIDKYAVESHPCVLLSDTFDVGDKLYGFGYTDAYVNGESFTPEIEGITRNPYLIKLKQAQVIPGFSGSPLLNLRTGGVCGVTRKTRDRSSDLGGRAIPASIVLSSFRDLPDIQRDLSQSETEWNETLTATQKAFLGISKHESNFKEHVAELYRLLHYSVATDKAFAGRTVDHFIERRVGDFPIQRAIATFSNEVAASDVDSFLATMRLVRQSFPAAQGTIVSSQQFIADVQLQANAEGIQLTSSRDLEAQLFDGHTYAKQIHDEIEHNARYNCSMYIEPEIGEELRGAGNPASEVLDKWLSDPLWNQLTILGDVGTGKTFLTRMLSYRLSEQFIADPLTARLPIRIDLRNADRQLTLQTLVLSHFAEVGMSDVTFDVFKHALSRGRIVLILDGFDEMAARVTPQVTERNFQELAHAATGHAKVLLTCRTHYFRSRSEEEEVILGDTGNYGSEFARDLYWDLISRKGFHIAYLRPFNLWQIESYVNRVKGRDAPQAIKKIREIYNLEELCQRPLLLEMIVKSIDKIDARNISAAALYQVFTDAWIHRDKWRDVLTPDDKLEFLTGLSRSLFAEERTAIHHSSLTDHLKRELASRVKDARQLVEMDNEIRTASFLTRDDEGNYGFAHKSYREFF
ncbi:MAG: trypsin-like peptidase domain-containing protein, partial [Planctomycetota bacterium]